MKWWRLYYIVYKNKLGYRESPRHEACFILFGALLFLNVVFFAFFRFLSAGLTAGGGPMKWRLDYIMYKNVLAFLHGSALCSKRSLFLHLLLHQTDWEFGTQWDSIRSCCLKWRLEAEAYNVYHRTKRALLTQVFKRSYKCTSNHSLGLIN